jgi:hypothetical protein
VACEEVCSISNQLEDKLNQVDGKECHLHDEHRFREGLVKVLHLVVHRQDHRDKVAQDDDRNEYLESPAGNESPATCWKRAFRRRPVGLLPQPLEEIKNPSDLMELVVDENIREMDPLRCLLGNPLGPVPVHTYRGPRVVSPLPLRIAYSAPQTPQTRTAAQAVRAVHLL